MTAAHYVAGLRRRRTYADRARLLGCGRCTDPWTCQCVDPDNVTEECVDGYVAAAQHLLAQGLTPSLNIAAMRVMWRRGGQDQRLAVQLSELWEVPA